MCIIKVEHLGYSYRNKYKTVEVLKDINCTFGRGNLSAIVGPSGGGKTTFLSLLAGLDLPRQGKVFIENKSISTIDRDRYRREVASVIFQDFNLFPLLTAIENIVYPMELRGISRKAAFKKANQLIEEIGLPKAITNQRPLMMSGGEQQRVAIARALAVNGKIILADEPTGNLDTANGEIIINLLERMAHSHNYAVIIVTHDLNIASRADKVYRMCDGSLTIER